MATDGKPSRHRAQLEAVRGVFRFSGRQLLVTLVALFVVFPFVESYAWGGAAISILFTLVMFSALLAVGGGKKRHVFIAGMVLLIPALTLRWLPHMGLMREGHPISLAAYSLFVAFVTFQLVLYVVRAVRVDAEVLSAGVSIYLLIGWLWALLFAFCDLAVPGSFHFQSNEAHVASLYEMFYFSFGTLTTAGYGDIVPVSGAARMLSSMESVLGVLYLAVLVSRLVSSYGTRDSAS